MEFKMACSVHEVSSNFLLHLFQIDINHWTIMQNIKNTLQEIIHLPALWQYYATWINWFSTSFDAIDW